MGNRHLKKKTNHEGTKGTERVDIKMQNEKLNSKIHNTDYTDKNIDNTDLFHNLCNPTKSVLSVFWKSDIISGVFVP